MNRENFERLNRGRLLQASALLGISSVITAQVVSVSRDNFDFLLYAAVFCFAVAIPLLSFEFFYQTLQLIVGKELIITSALSMLLLGSVAAYLGVLFVFSHICWLCAVAFLFSTLVLLSVTWYYGGLLRRYLFSLEPDFASDLDNKQVSDKLKNKFTNHKEQLTSQARIEVNQAGSSWTIIDQNIIDGNREYVIHSGNQGLNVYLMSPPTLFSRAPTDPDSPST